MSSVTEAITSVLGKQGERLFVGQVGSLRFHSSDVWLPADDFYDILRQWHDAFEAEWLFAPKSSKAD
jgi:hypothetical protein